jgi:hypothetical protein
MTKYKQAYTYKGNVFMIEVALYASMERRPGGKVTHLVTVTELGGMYNRTHVTDSETKVLELVEFAQEDIIKFVEGKTRPLSKLEQALIDAGFKLSNV